MMKFLDFYTEKKQEAADTLITEGGLGGHMAHPTDIMNPDELMDFFERFFTGSIEGTEKVDGFNLFVGYDGEDGTLYSRKVETPVSDINKYFPLTHPGASAFRAGFKAISRAFDKLTDNEKIEYDLIDEEGNSKYFINCEIIYGEIPNIIQYSETDNFIVFHSYHKGMQGEYAIVNNTNTAEKLKKLAQRIGRIIVNSEVVYFLGRPGKAYTETHKDKSEWVFRGPIDIDYEKMKEELRGVAAEWKELDEYKNLKKVAKDKSSTEKDKFLAMKELTQKIGNKILTLMVSDLFSGVRKTAADHPKIEGIALKDPKYGLVKITGDFRNKIIELWGPVMDKVPEIENKVKKSIHDILEISGTTILKRTWTKYNNSPEEFLKFKNPKLYANQDELYTTISKMDLIKILKGGIKELDAIYDEVEESTNIKKEFVLKNIRVVSLKMQKLLAMVPEIKNRSDLMGAYYKTFYYGE